MEVTYGQWHDQQIDDFRALFEERGCLFTLSKQKRSWPDALQCLTCHGMTLSMTGIYSET